MQPAAPLSAYAGDASTKSEANYSAAAQTLTMTAVEQARQAAVARASRARDLEQTLAEAEAEAERERQVAEAREFAAWEKDHTAEITKVEEQADQATKTQFVLERHIRWVAPLKSYRLSAHFGQAGGYWTSGYHTGQDFAAPSGASISTVSDGEVVSVSWEYGYGNQVKVRHLDGTETWYAHMSGFAVGAGQWVSAGTVIGYVGSTGNSTGPHLHLEVHPGGEDAVEPLAWLREHGVGL